MEQEREKRKDRRNEQLVAALADLDQERWHRQGLLSPQSAEHGAVSASPGGLTPDPKRQQPEQDDKDMAAPTSPQRGQSGLSSQADTPVPLHRSAASGRPQPPLPQVQCTMEVGGGCNARSPGALTPQRVVGGAGRVVRTGGAVVVVLSANFPPPIPPLLPPLLLLGP